jgi:hypothetical protein
MKIINDERNPVNKFKKALMTLGAAMALTASGIGVNAAIAAPSAEAGTSSGCFVDKGNYGGYRYGIWCEVDYDWFEEVVLGYRDGLKLVWRQNEPCAPSYYGGKCYKAGW